MRNGHENMQILLPLHRGVAVMGDPLFDETVPGACAARRYSRPMAARQVFW
jgi:hypothetical protein